MRKKMKEFIWGAVVLVSLGISPPALAGPDLTDLTFMDVQSARVFLATPGLLTRAMLTEEMLPDYTCNGLINKSDDLDVLLSLLAENVDTSTVLSPKVTYLRNAVVINLKNGAAIKLLMGALEKGDAFRVRLKIGSSGSETFAAKPELLRELAGFLLSGRTDVSNLHYCETILAH